MASARSLLVAEAMTIRLWCEHYLLHKNNATITTTTLHLARKLFLMGRQSPQWSND
jgi:hypothetical protein